ncbi:MAG: hypothetical protein ACRCSG_01215 [Cellulosilyticaceae bacterium]
MNDMKSQNSNIRKCYFSKIVVVILITILACFCLAGCSQEETVTFEGEIIELHEKQMLVITTDDVGFDKASVYFNDAKIKGTLAKGAHVIITIFPEIRESYPVQVTAKKIEVTEINKEVKK